MTFYERNWWWLDHDPETWIVGSDNVHRPTEREAFARIAYQTYYYRRHVYKKSYWNKAYARKR